MPLNNAQLNIISKKYGTLFVEGGDQLAAHLQLVLEYEPDHEDELVQGVAGLEEDLVRAPVQGRHLQLETGLTRKT